MSFIFDTRSETGTLSGGEPFSRTYLYHGENLLGELERVVELTNPFTRRSDWRWRTLGYSYHVHCLNGDSVMGFFRVPPGGSAASVRSHCLSNMKRAASADSRSAHLDDVAGVTNHDGRIGV